MSGKFHRKTLRFKEYDYSRSGYYFITICTFYKEHLFGEIVDDEMNLNDSGKFVQKCWCDITTHYPNVELDSFIVMPNHVHGIIIIKNDKDVGVQNFEPRQNPDDNNFVTGYKISGETEMKRNIIRFAITLEPIQKIGKMTGIFEIIY